MSRAEPARLSMRGDELWGGRLRDVDVDLPSHTVVLTVHVLDSGAGIDRDHVLRFDGVREFHFGTDVPEPWDYVELTELHASFDAVTGEWTVTCVLWTDGTDFTVRCTAVALDGRAWA